MKKSFCLLLLLLWLSSSRLEAGSVFVGEFQTIDVIDTDTMAIGDTIPIGNNTGGYFVFNPALQLFYVILQTLANDNIVQILDPQTNTFAPTIITAGESTAPRFGGAITPNNQFLYVPNSATDDVTVINTATNQVIATIAGLDAPWGAQNSLDGQFIYVANNGSNTVSVIDTGSNMITATITVANSPSQMAITPDGSFIYLATQSNVINVIDTATNTVAATLAIPGNFKAVAINQAGTFAYALSSTTVLVIEIATNTVVATIPGFMAPTYAAFTPDGKFLYVSNNGADIVSVVDTGANAIVSNIAATGSFLYGLGIFFPPSSPIGKQIANRFLTQTDLVNTISWSPPTSGFIPVSYQIYRDASLTELVGTVAGNILTFEDHNRVPKQIYSYFIEAVDSFGNLFEIGSVTVLPR